MPHFYGAVGAPIVSQHRWRPRRRPLARGDGRYNLHAVLYLQLLRHRGKRHHYWRNAVAGALTALGHVALVFLLLLSQSLAPATQPNQGDTSPIDVRIVHEQESDEESVPPPPPPLEPPEQPDNSSRSTRKTQSVARQQQPRSSDESDTDAALPPVPVNAPEAPDITPEPAFDKTLNETETVADTAAMAEAERATDEPDVDEGVPEIKLSALPQVVPEPSAMAEPAPQLPDDVATTTVVTRATRKMPRIPIGDTAGGVGKPASGDLTATVSTRVDAGKSELPEVKARTPGIPNGAPPAPQVKAELSAPDVEVTAPERTASQVETAPLAPIPSTPIPQFRAETGKLAVKPDVAVPERNTMDAAVAKVSKPAAAATTATTARASTTASDKTRVRNSSAAPARTGSAANPRASSGDTSWVTADDQFDTGARNGGWRPSGAHAGKDKGSVVLQPRGNSDVMTRKSDKLGYEPTRFDKYWAPENETLADRLLRRFVQKLTWRKTFHLAPGLRLHCRIGPVVVFFGCTGDAPRKPSNKSDDRRLNMAPAGTQSAAHAAASPAESTAGNFTSPVRAHSAPRSPAPAACETARVAGSPPPPGCPDAPVKPSQSDQWYPDSGGR